MNIDNFDLIKRNIIELKDYINKKKASVKSALIT